MYEVKPDILEISKALGEETRFSIYREIASAGHPLTVKDLVARFGMHHSAIRIHLNKLEDARLIVSQKQHNPGTVGRPQLAFLLHPETLSITLPTRNYEFLSDLTMSLLQSGGGADSAEGFGYTWGGAYVQKVDHGWDAPVPFDLSVDILIEVLNSLGTSIEKSPTAGPAACILEQHNCPFLEVARRHQPLVCTLLRGVARGILEALTGAEVRWEHKSRLIDGDDACEIRVSLVEPALEFGEPATLN